MLCPGFFAVALGVSSLPVAVGHSASQLCVLHHLVTHFAGGGHLGTSHVGATVDKAAVTTLRLVFWWPLPTFSQGGFQGVGLLGQREESASLWWKLTPFSCRQEFSFCSHCGPGVLLSPVGGSHSVFGNSVENIVVQFLGSVTPSNISIRPSDSPPLWHWLLACQFGGISSTYLEDILPRPAQLAALSSPLFSCQSLKEFSLPLPPSACDQQGNAMMLSGGPGLANL